MKLPISLLIAGAGFLLSSCISFVSVKDVSKSPDAKGFRYNLPATYVKVTPAADGSATFETFVMEDPSAQYAIRTRTLLGKHKTTVKKSATNPALLSEVSADLDADEVAESAVATAGDIAETKIETDAAAREAAAKAKAAADEVVTEKQIAVEKAKLELGAATPATQSDLRLAVAKAELELRYAREARQNILGAREGGGDPSKTPAPAFYRLDDDGAGGVKLVPVAFRTKTAQGFKDLGQQPKLPTSKKAAPETEVPEPLLFQSHDQVVIFPDGTIKPEAIKIESTVALKAITIVSYIAESGAQTPGPEMPSVFLSAGDIALLRFPAAAKPGRYKIKFAVTPQGSDETVSPAPLTIEVVRGASP